MGDDAPRFHLIDAHRLTWTSYDVVSDQQLRVHFIAGNEECFGVHAEVTEDRGSVQVALWQGTLPEAPDACAAVARSASLLIDVDESLAGRPVVQPGP